MGRYQAELLMLINMRLYFVKYGSGYVISWDFLGKFSNYESAPQLCIFPSSPTVNTLFCWGELVFLFEGLGDAD